MYLPLEKATSIIQLLLEGMSVRSAERITGVHRDTIMRLLVVAGTRCERLMQNCIRHIAVSVVQCDEFWGFVIENAIAESIKFFHMDALSATVPMKIDADL